MHPTRGHTSPIPRGQGTTGSATSINSCTPRGVSWSDPAWIRDHWWCDVSKLLHRTWGQPQRASLAWALRNSAQTEIPARNTNEEAAGKPLSLTSATPPPRRGVLYARKRKRGGPQYTSTRIRILENRCMHHSSSTKFWSDHGTLTVISERVLSHSKAPRFSRKRAKSKHGSPPRN